MIEKREVKKMMDALMLRYWGIFTIDPTYREKIKNKNYFSGANSILDLNAIDCDTRNDKTVIAIAVPYALEGSVYSSRKNMAKVEAFGWEFDYHVRVKALLMKIKDGLEVLNGHSLEQATVYVDTSPYNDREVGFYAGLGQVGYNHLLIHEDLGSNFFIGYLVVHERLPIDPSALVKPEDLPHSLVHPYCEACGKCVKACPSNVCGLGLVDMTNCLSSITQSKEMISEKMRRAIHDRLYGCSVCQIVCPLNHNETPHQLLTLTSENWVDALALLAMTQQDFKREYGHMGFSWRPLWIYKRNALIVLGNTGDPAAYAALLKLDSVRCDEKLADYYNWAIKHLEKRMDHESHKFEQIDTFEPKID